MDCSVSKAMSIGFAFKYFIFGSWIYLRKKYKLLGPQSRHQFSEARLACFHVSLNLIGSLAVKIKFNKFCVFWGRFTPSNHNFAERSSGMYLLFSSGKVHSDVHSPQSSA